MKKQPPDKDVLVYIVLEMEQSEVEGIVKQFKESKKLKFKYYWINQDWRQNETQQTTTESL